MFQTVMRVNGSISGCASQTLMLNWLYVLISSGVSVSLRESVVNQKDLINVALGPDQEVIRLHVSMDE